MIHTRVRSFSDSSVDPTHGFGFLLSRSNSAAMSAGHCVLSFFSGLLVEHGQCHGGFLQSCRLSYIG